MHGWIKKARAMIAKDGWTVRVTVSSAQGSVPREAGTTMLVGLNTAAGTIGGGALEHLAIQQARLLGDSRSDLPKEIDVPLGPKTRQCCGGRVKLILERLHPGNMEAHLAGTGDDLRTPLYLFGAGHVGKAIISRMDNLPFQIRWIDNRANAFPENTPDNVEICLTESSIDLVKSAPAGCAFLVMTYSHQIDFALTAAILKRGDSSYCGLIGSKSKRKQFLKRFTEEDLNPDDCTRLTCPIGLPSIKGKEPGIIAVAVIAQLLELFE